MGYCLTKADYEDIRVLTIITESIFDSYKILAKLEAEGKKDSIEYQRTVEALKTSIQMEPVIYGRIGNLFPKVNAIAEYLKKTEQNPLVQSGFELIITGTEKALVLRRIMNRLSGLISIEKEMKSEIKNVFKEEEDEENSYLSIISKFLEDAATHLSDDLGIVDAFRSDDFSCFLAILQKIIDSPFQKESRSRIVLAKYYIAFTQEEIEKNMLDKNFEVSSQVYLRAPLLAELQQQDQLFTALLRNKTATILVQEQTKLLLEKYDNQMLSDSYYKGEAILRTCILRTGLLSLNDDEIMQLNEAFHDQIETDEYLRMHPSNSDVERLIANAYRQVRNDKSIPVIISMKQKKY